MIGMWQNERRKVGNLKTTYKGTYVVLYKLISLMKIKLSLILTVNFIKYQMKRAALFAYSTAALFLEL
jgi:hypothetical protein